jgi:nitroreductase
MYGTQRAKSHIILYQLLQEGSVSIEEIIRKNRSCRRFYPSKKVSKKLLRGLINLARLSASAANLQPLKYIISNTPDKNAKIFPCLLWAGYLKDWPGPEEKERPPAYIIILGDKEITRNFSCDQGIAAQSILLGATEQGLGGCILGSIDRERLRATMNIPRRYEILLAIALGRPRESVVIEEAKDSIRYWRDEKNVHHVPKRPIDEIILNFS